MKTRLIKTECVRPSGEVQRLEWYTAKPREKAISAVARKIESSGLGLVRECKHD